MRWNASIVPAVLAVAVLAACTSAPESGPADPADLATLDMMAPVISTQAPAATGEMQKAVEQLTGKKLNITWVPNSSYNDKTNITLASGTIPEVMVVQGKIPAFVQNAKAGAFWDLTDRIDKYPNLAKANKQTRQSASVDGHLYGLPRERQLMRVAVTIRKDWLAKLGLAEPATVQDLYAVAKAFTENDPDGNGKRDTYGVLFPKWPSGYASGSPYDVIETWFGAPNGWGPRDGKLVPGFDTAQFLDGARYIRRLFDEKLVNPDFATLDSGKPWEDAFTNGKGGIIIDTSSRSLNILSTFKQKDAANYGKYVTVVGNLAGPDGAKHSLPTTGYSGFLAVSKQSVPTEAELGDVLGVLDKLAAKEGQILLNNGLEGRNFTLSGGGAKPVTSTDPAIVTLKNDLQSFGQIGSLGNDFYQPVPAGAPEQEIVDKRAVFHAKDLETAVYNPAAPFVSATYTSQGAQLDLIVGDAQVKYFAGQLDEAGLKKETQRWHSEGGDKVASEMNELYAKAGGK
ncbi:extracellular solute-binding protein [Dactylosporangium sp. NPDC051541]|uniref:extracellular solute-binding protein n=1 Tax=Dactylosporangium sp. NPDC051541 TaxID=3363977 RepID=UPI0037B6AC38